MLVAARSLRPTQLSGALVDTQRLSLVFFSERLSVVVIGHVDPLHGHYQTEVQQSTIRLTSRGRRVNRRS